MFVWDMNWGWLVRIAVVSLCGARVIVSPSVCKLMIVSAVVSVLSN